MMAPQQTVELAAVRQAWKKSAQMLLGIAVKVTLAAKALPLAEQA
jgi:hypothetical protein